MRRTACLMALKPIAETADAKDPGFSSITWPWYWEAATQLHDGQVTSSGQWDKGKGDVCL